MADDGFERGGSCDYNIRSTGIGRVWLDPGISTGGIGRFGHHIVAKVAGGIHEESSPPVTIDELTPGAFDVASIGEHQVEVVGIGWSVWGLSPEINALDLLKRNTDLHRNAFHKSSALHVSTHET